MSNPSTHQDPPPGPQRSYATGGSPPPTPSDDAGKSGPVRLTRCASGKSSARSHRGRAILTQWIVLTSLHAKPEGTTRPCTASSWPNPSFYTKIGP